ncbi:Type 1 glutamine amidotransferase-like domain-containing protein [Microbacterium sp. ARD31]|jgi:dipeptidase E|uniref:Type 1 glutamine amidotransferase-like domain-containing protein n=1 Tax=Microbacterium sp. ARD31 TaxID=2962576 RepID=UPI0028824349|nr:Type 1 glutamine amidotransferase-like domain-containing protein [Microbacterium sp. ARD31]MDT0183471.1 Type 1 glutamine amidotransferase-like domain-containing protein [Microbacterium sp. ARD31]
MKLLLTSGGVTNDSIRAALVELLGKPIEEATALAVPSAQWGHPMCRPETVHGFATDRTPPTMTGLGWASVGLLELTALPTIEEARWLPWVQRADVLLVDGGEATYLAHWIEESGLGAVLPSLEDTVWVGVSAGSMALAPRIGDRFTHWRPDDGDAALGLVEFSIYPHVGLFASNTMEDAEQWAAGLGNPAYALDEQSAVVVDGDRVEVVSEGEWRHFR